MNVFSIFLISDHLMLRNIIIKFEGCYHGHSDSLLIKAGSGAATFGSASSAGVPEDFAKYTLVLPYNDIDAIEDAFEKMGSKIAGAAGRGFVNGLAGVGCDERTDTGTGNHQQLGGLIQRAQGPTGQDKATEHR